MNIEQIKGNRYIPQKVGKSNSASEADQTKSRSKTGNAAGNAQGAINVSLSESKFDDETAFAKKLLADNRKESLDSLKKIKQKIENGAYNKKEIHQKISTLIKNDISTLTHIFPHSSDDENVSPKLSDGYKKQLLENPDMVKKVSKNIAKDIEHI
jgi:predicted phage-related endonuclease